MATAAAQALLDWYRANHCDDNPRSAWHTLHRNGPLALTACVTAVDYATVIGAMEIAAILVKQLPEWAINPPPQCEVEFNNQRVTLWCMGIAIETRDI